MDNTINLLAVEQAIEEFLGEPTADLAAGFDTYDNELSF